jgi:hypothetical protein
MVVDINCDLEHPLEHELTRIRGVHEDSEYVNVSTNHAETELEFVYMLPVTVNIEGYIFRKTNKDVGIGLIDRHIAFVPVLSWHGNKYEHESVGFRIRFGIRNYYTSVEIAKESRPYLGLKGPTLYIGELWHFIMTTVSIAFNKDLELTLKSEKPLTLNPAPISHLA